MRLELLWSRVETLTAGTMTRMVGKALVVNYGDPVRQMLPTVIHPNEILDGAVVRGFMGRNATTYAIQNHAVIRALYAQHEQTLWFAGLALTVAQATEPERVRSACMAAGIVAHVLGADGAVFTKIGGGAPHGATAGHGGCGSRACGPAGAG
jgi:hypothetical protein